MIVCPAPGRCCASVIVIGQHQRGVHLLSGSLQSLPIYEVNVRCWGLEVPSSSRVVSQEVLAWFAKRPGDACLIVFRSYVSS